MNNNSSIKERILEGIDEESKRRYILDKIDLFFTTTDLNERKDISSELFIYEKVCMPEYQGDCSVLILSVGMQKEPIILSIISVKPEHVFLLHTQKSQKTARHVIEDLDINSMNIDFHMVEIDEIDAANNYRVLKEKVLKQIQEIKGRILVDPTGGRKIMGVTLGTFAFYYRIPMIYLHVDEKNGLPVPFTERIREIENPYIYYGDIELSLLEKYFNIFSYDAALEVSMNLENTVKDPALYGKLSIINEIIELYRDWDTFLHSKHYENPDDREESTYLAKRLLDIFKKKIERFGYEFIDHVAIKGNIEFLEHIEHNWRNKANICDTYRLIDMLCNADRRFKQGRFDDATARLYRCLEMCSTIKLEALGIGDTADPDYEAFTKANGITINDVNNIFHSNSKNIPNVLGLNQQMKLLGLVDDSIVVIYNGMKKGKDSVMNRRNRSILAHGTNPITRVDYDILKKRTVSIIIKTVGKNEFDELTNKAKFPKIKL